MMSTLNVPFLLAAPDEISVDWESSVAVSRTFSTAAEEPEIVEVGWGPKGPTQAYVLADGFSGTIISEDYRIGSFCSIYLAEDGTYGDLVGETSWAPSTYLYVAGGAVNSITSSTNTDCYMITGGEIGTLTLRSRAVFTMTGGKIDHLNVMVSDVIRINGTAEIGYYSGLSPLYLSNNTKLNGATITQSLVIGLESQYGEVVTVSGTVTFTGATSAFETNFPYQVDISGATFVVDLKGETGRSRAVLTWHSTWTNHFPAALIISVTANQAAGNYTLVSNAADFNSYFTLIAEDVNLGEMRIGDQTLYFGRKYSLVLQSATLYLVVEKLADFHEVSWSNTILATGSGPVHALEPADGFSGTVGEESVTYARGFDQDAYSVYLAAESSYGDIVAGDGKMNFFYIAGGETVSVTGSSQATLIQMMAGSVETVQLGSGRSTLLQLGGSIASIVSSGLNVTETIRIYGEVGNMTNFFGSGDTTITVMSGGNVDYFEGNQISFSGPSTLGGADIYRRISLSGAVTVTGEITLHGDAAIVFFGASQNLDAATFTIDLTGTRRTAYAGTAAEFSRAGTLTLFVSGFMTGGEYILLSGSENFDRTFTVKDSSGTLGTVSMENVLDCGKVRYSLVERDTYLYLSVENIMMSVDWRGLADAPLEAYVVPSGFTGSIATEDYLFPSFYSAILTGGTMAGFDFAGELPGYLYLYDCTGVSGISGANFSVLLDGSSSGSNMQLANLLLYGDASFHTTNSTTVSNKLVLGGKDHGLSGTVVIGPGGHVEIARENYKLGNGILLFDLTGVAPAGSSTMIQGIGAADFLGSTISYTLSGKVADDQATGRYLIGEGVSAFAGSFQIRSGSQSQYVSTSTYFEYNGGRYFLSVSDSRLYLNHLSLVNADFGGFGYVTQGLVLYDGFSGSIEAEGFKVNQYDDSCVVFAAGGNYGDIIGAEKGRNHFLIEGGMVSSITGDAANDNFFMIRGGTVDTIRLGGANSRLRQTGGYIGNIIFNRNIASSTHIEIQGETGRVTNFFGPSYSNPYPVLRVIPGGSVGYFEGEGLTLLGGRLGDADVYRSFSMASYGNQRSVVTGTVTFHDNAIFMLSNENDLSEAEFNIDLSGQRRFVPLCTGSMFDQVSAWSITVTDTMAGGAYHLLNGITEFTGTFTVKSSSETLGMLSLNQIIRNGSVCYTLFINESGSLNFLVADNIVNEVKYPGENAPSVAVPLSGGESCMVNVTGNLVKDASGNDVYSVCTTTDETYGEIIFGGELDNYILIDGGAVGTVSCGDRLNGDLYIHMTAGTAGNIYAGFFRSDGETSRAAISIAGGAVTGNIIGNSRNSGSAAEQIEIKVGEATIHNVYGAGAFSSGSAVIGSVSIELDSHTGKATNSYVFGGAYSNGAASGISVLSVSISASGTEAGGYIHGGGFAYNGGKSHVETAAVTIVSGTHNGYIYGGGRAEAGGSATVGEVSLVISGGTFNGYVFGGGYSKNAVSTIGSDVALRVSGGYFNGTIYGGGNCQGTGSAVIAGDISITIDLSQNTVAFKSGSGITLGGNSSSQVLGDTRLTLTGDGSNLRTADGVFTGWLNAGGGTNANQTHVLSFAGYYDQDFQAKVRGFNTLEFTGDTQLRVTPGTVWSQGCDYTFDLTGRTLNAADAFLIQKSGNLGIDSDSLFTIRLSDADLSGDAGSFLLIDGIANLPWQLDDMQFHLFYDGRFGSGFCNGPALQYSEGSTAFNLVYDQAAGSFALNWSRIDGPEDDLFRQTANMQQSLLA